MGRAAVAEAAAAAAEAQRGGVRGGQRDIRVAFQRRPPAGGSGKKSSELQDQQDEMEEEDQQPRQQQQQQQQQEEEDEEEEGEDEDEQEQHEVVEEAEGWRLHLSRRTATGYSGVHPTSSAAVESAACLTTPPHLYAWTILKAQAPPTHPGAPPEHLGGSPWPQQPASARPQVEDFPPFNHQAAAASRLRPSGTTGSGTRGRLKVPSG